MAHIQTPLHFISFAFLNELVMISQLLFTKLIVQIVMMIHANNKRGETHVSKQENSYCG